MKTETKVDRTTLESVVNEVEAPGPLGSRDALWKASTPLYNERKPEGFPLVTFSVVMSRVLAWGLPIKTQPGRRTMSAEQRQEAGVRLKKTKQSRRKPVPKTLDVETMRRRTPAALHPLIDRIINPKGRGSLKAAVKLNCLQCCSFVRKEVARCSSFACPLYRFRPYQGDAVTETELVETAEDI